MKIGTTIFFILGFVLSNAQNQDPFFQFEIDSLVDASCKGIIGKRYKNLMVYSTTNAKWNGSIDTSICYEVITLSESYYENVVLLNSKHNNQKIWFVDTTIDIPFVKDSVLRYIDNSFRKNCRIQENERWLLVENFDTAKGNYFIDTISLHPSDWYCYCGNKFYRNIKGLIVGIKVHDISSGAYVVAAASLAFENSIAVVSDSIRMNYRLSDSVQHLRSDFRDSSFVFADADTSKYKKGVHTITFEPIKPVNKRQSLIANFYSGAFVQPGVELKGGMWDSANNIRHQLDFTIDEGELCLVFIIDLVTKGDDKVTFKGGSVNHGSQRACMMFEEKAELVIAENAHLYYGNNGRGILGFKPGAQLVLKDSASITINNKLVLVDYWDNQVGGNIPVHLKAGNSLVFGENAMISNGPYEYGSIKLDVYMEGGKLDISKLDETSKGLINIIYPEQNPVLPKLAQAFIFPNPTTKKFSLIFESDTNSVLTWQLFDLNGNHLENGDYKVRDSRNEIEFDLSFNRSGVYLLQFGYLGETYYNKVVLVNGL